MFRFLFAIMVGIAAGKAVSQAPPAITRSQADQRYIRSISTPLDALFRALGLGDVLPYDEPGRPLGVLENGSIGSAQTGWGTPVGIRSAFNSVSFGVSNLDPTFPVSGVRLWIYDTDVNGAVLADVRQPIFVPPGGVAEVSVRLPKEIRSQKPLYVRWNTNGKTGVFRTNPTAVFPISEGWPQFGMSNNTSLDSLHYVKPGGTTQGNGYFRFEMRPFDRSTSSGDLVTTAETLVSTATFTGYGSYAGAPTHPYNSIDLGLAWFRADTRATSFRLLIRRQNSSGPVLAETTVRGVDWTGVPAFRPLSIRFDLGKEVDSGPVWLEVVGDGTFSFSKIANGTYGVSPFGPTRYATNASLRYPNWVNSVTQWNLWARFTRWQTWNVGTGFGELDLRLSLARTLLGSLAPRVNLPSRVYAISGREWSLYFDQIVVPVSGIRAENSYDLDVTCPIGRQQAERFVLLSGDSPAPGEYPLTVDVWDRGVKVASATTTLVVQSSTVGDGVSRKILFAGDSLTDQIGILSELKRLFAADGSLNATFVGSKSGAVKDSLGVNQTVSHEGYGGKTALFLQSDNAPTTGSPFVHAGGGTFNFGAYLAAKSIAMAAGDWFVLEFGTNEVFSATSDAAVRTAFWQYKLAVDAMVASARTGVPGIRILLVTPPGPSGSQDAFADDYGTGQSRWRYKRNAALFSEMVREWYDSAINRAEGLWIAMPGHSWDTANNARRAVDGPINAYSSGTMSRMNDGVHPGGYNEGGGAFQIASHLYQFLKSQEG